MASWYSGPIEDLRERARILLRAIVLGIVLDAIGLGLIAIDYFDVSLR